MENENILMEKRMKVGLDIPDNLVLGARDLVKEGKYKTISEFVIRSIEIQLKEEKFPKKEPPAVYSDIDSLLVDDVIAASGPPPEDNEDKTPFPLLKSELDENSQALSDHDNDWDIIDKFSKDVMIENYNLPNGYDQYSLKILNPDKILWGQINRYFPLKAALRGIMNVNENEFDDDGLADASHFKKDRQLLEKYSALGNFLKNSDAGLNRKRDKKLSTGFPVGEGWRKEKSKERFMCHFLFDKRKDGLLDGGLARLNFIKVYERDGEKLKVGITKKGYEFCKLFNPIFDDAAMVTVQDAPTLSDDEKQFIISHLKENYPAEFDGTVSLLQKIKNGADSPDKLRNSFSDYFGSGVKNGAVSTLVNGLMSRCYELSLIEKEKTGLYVTYRITEYGGSLLNN